MYIAQITLITVQYEQEYLYSRHIVMASAHKHCTNGDGNYENRCNADTHDYDADENACCMVTLTHSVSVCCTLGGVTVMSNVTGRTPKCHTEHDKVTLT